jgi:hypothetical protein
MLKDCERKQKFSRTVDWKIRFKTLTTLILDLTLIHIHMGLCKTNYAKSDDRLFEVQNEEMLRLISRCS